jgi:serine/threonine-protein kinase HipA
MHERKLRFAMKIGGDYRVFPHRNTWREAAFELDIDADATVARVETLAVCAPDAFAAAASSHDIVSLKRDLPGRLVDLVAARAARCVQLLRAT